MCFQLIAQGKAPLLFDKMKYKTHKKKAARAKKRTRRTKNIYTTDNVPVNIPERATTSQLNDIQKASTKTVSRNTSPIKIKRASTAFSTKKCSLSKSRKIVARKSLKKLIVSKKQQNE